MFVSHSKFGCSCGAINAIRRLCTKASTNIQILSDLTGIPRIKAKFYIEKHKIHSKDSELLIQSIHFCQNLGYSNDTILGTPHLLTTHPLELEQHYLSMEEGGFWKIGPETLAKARSLMKKPVKVLKSKDLIKCDTLVPEKLVSYIEDSNIRNSLPIPFSDGDIWNKIHLDILQSFLMLKFDVSEDDIIKLFRIHQMIKNKSLRIIQENIKIAEELGFEQKKILKYGYLLHNYPAYTRTTLRDFPNLAGADMRKAMRLYPKLVMTPPRNIIKIYGILKEFDIADETIANQMNILHMSPETVRLRLQEIERSPDLRVLLSHPRLLKLVVHHNRAKSRLSFLQQLQLKCTSLTILKTDENNQFEEYVKEGKDVNKINDVSYFVKDIFGSDTSAIMKKLKRHPFYLQVPLKDMKETYDFLKQKNFRHTNIFNVPHVLLYPLEKLENAMKQMKCNRIIHYNTLSQVNKLNLLLYFIEKEHHFTGNGIWKDSNCTDLEEKNPQ